MRSWALAVLGGVLSGLLCVSEASAQVPDDAFDGSFRLETGEVVTGGVFVEDGRERFLYLDTERLDKGGLFERVGDTWLRSIVPTGVEIEVFPASDGLVNALVWREAGREPVEGERIHPHSSRSIRFTSEDGTELDGRLLLPRCGGSHPLVVAVHGSGPVNRYGGPYHTFFLLRGVAVLAYDKRGFTRDPDTWQEPDLATLSADAAAAMRFVATLPEIDNDRIGFFGSSQAGWVVPRAALEAPDTDFLILRAGAALSALDTVLHEVRQEWRDEGLSGLDLDSAVALRRELYELARRGAPLSASDDLVAPYLDEPWYRTAFGQGPVSGRWSPWAWEWAHRNIAVAATSSLERFGGPVLWFLAGRDENVPLVPTRAALERSFARAPGSDHEIVVLEEALHSFLIPSPDGPPRFSDGFFSRMGSWMAERGIADAACWGAVEER